MSKKQILKQKFSTGKKPTQADFSSLIDEAAEGKEIAEHILDESFDKGVLNSEIERRLTEKEEEYAPRLMGVETSLADKASTSYVETLMANITDGSPKELFYSINAMKTKYPSGAIGPMLVFDSSHVDGAHSYIWDGMQWQDAGIYQSSGIADNSITLEKLGPLTDALNLYSDPLMNDVDKYKISSPSYVMDVEHFNLNGNNNIKFTNNNAVQNRVITYGRQIDIPIDGVKYLGGNIYVKVFLTSLNIVESPSPSTCSMNIIPFNSSGTEITGNRQTVWLTKIGLAQAEYLPPVGTDFVRVRFDIRVNIGTGAGDSMTIRSVLVQTPNYNNHQHGVGVVELMELQDRIKALEDGGGIQLKKLMHLSVDDAILVFRELHESTYSSIFEHSILGFFRQMNELYGAVFSLYFFYQNGDFNLSQMTDRFKDEFEENSDWLKFGFHSGGTGKNYSVDSGFLEDYNEIIGHLVRACGKESIDKVPRTHNFGGTLEAVKAWKNADHGIIGLLSADDARNSHYHTDAQRDHLITYDELFDDVNSVYFARTDIRLERHATVALLNTKLNSVLNDVNQRDKIIIFTHEPRLYEQIYLDKIEACCVFAVENGYLHDFPMYHMNTRALI